MSEGTHTTVLVYSLRRFFKQHDGMPSEVKCHIPDCPACTQFHEWVTWTMASCDMTEKGGAFIYRTMCPTKNIPIGQKISLSQQE